MLQSQKINLRWKQILFIQIHLIFEKKSENLFHVQTENYKTIYKTHKSTLCLQYDLKKNSNIIKLNKKFIPQIGFGIIIYQNLIEKDTSNSYLISIYDFKNKLS